MGCLFIVSIFPLTSLLLLNGPLCISGSSTVALKGLLLFNFKTKSGGNWGCPKSNCINRKWWCEVKGKCRTWVLKIPSATSWKQMCSVTPFCVWGIISSSGSTLNSLTKVFVPFFYFLPFRRRPSFPPPPSLGFLVTVKKLSEVILLKFFLV